MEKVREELAKLLFDWIDDDGWEWWEVDKDVRDHYRNKTDSILSLPALREALEKAEKWDKVREIADGDYCSRCFNRFKCPSEDYAPCPFSDIINEVEEG